MFGAAEGQKPGDTILTENGIAVTLETYHQADGGAGFGQARVDAMLVPGGTRQSLRTNAIAVRFDFTGLPYPAKGASFHYVDFGGSKDLAANDDKPLADGIVAMAGRMTGGTTVSVTTGPTAADSTPGTVTLSGPIKSLSVGGRDFWIDAVCAEP